MQVCYMNDEIVEVKVRIIKADGENEYTTLAPQEMRVFEVHVPEGSVLFVKKWSNNIVLLSHMPLAVIHGVYS